MRSDSQSVESSDEKAEPRPGLKWRAKLFLLCFIAFHVLTIVMAPLSFRAQGPVGPSPIIETISRPTNGYGQFIYADRGYAFFAPDPGPSHLIQAAVTSKNGARNEIMIPDLKQQWPRLMYHRHFMLAEYLHEIYQPKGPPPELIQTDRQAAEEWVRLRARYEHLRDSILDHLRDVHPDQDVAIRRIEHLIPDLMLYVEEPIALDDKRLYRVLLDNPVSFGNSRDQAAMDADRQDEAAKPVNGDEQKLQAPKRTKPKLSQPPEVVQAPQPGVRQTASQAKATEEANAGQDRDRETGP